MARTKQNAQEEKVHAAGNPTAFTRQYNPTGRAAWRKFPAYECSCNNNGKGCRIKQHKCIEPLAWNIKDGDVLEQTGCRLFTVFPKEVRDIIYNYAFTETSFNQPGQAPTPVDWMRNEGSLTFDRAYNFLLTCKAVYREAYLLPLSLNPLQLPWFGQTRHDLRYRLPWQFACISAFDITLRQVTLEGDYLYNFLFDPTGRGFPTGWHPEARHKGAFVAPILLGLKRDYGGSRRSCDFTLLPTYNSDDITYLGDALHNMSLPPDFEKPLSNMRLLRARPLTHLTLRILREHWWTWRDGPAGSSEYRGEQSHLALDPALGDGRTVTTTYAQMQELAKQRRDGDHPKLNAPASRKTPGWAHIIGKLTDITTLELILETFENKKEQLDQVVECAKTWRFPIAGTRHELAWDGKLRGTQWTDYSVEDRDDMDGYNQRPYASLELRIIRFTRRQIVSW